MTTLNQCRRGLGRLVALGLVLLAGGCGLSEYETRMEASQKWLARFDEEMRVLDEPVYAPKHKVKLDGVESENDDVKLFFRPTRGIKPFFSAALQPFAEKTPFDICLYRYDARPNAPPPVAVPGLLPPPPVIPVVPGIKEFYLGWQLADPKLQAEANAMNTFRDRIVGILAPGIKVQPSTWTTSPVGREPFSYQAFDVEDQAGNVLSFYVLEKSKTQVALVYRIEKAKKAGTERAVHLSLDTLALDGDVDTVLTKYLRRHALRTPPPTPPAPPLPP